MPRFFFDVINDEAIVDDIGLEMASLHAAQQEALRTLPVLAKEASPDGTREFAIEIRDDAGKKLLRATLTVKVEMLS